MALANVGCLLAQRQAEAGGRGVLLVDWDLEAPGLHRFFRGRVKRQFGSSEQEAFTRQPGLLDLFEELRRFVDKVTGSQSEPGRDAEDRLRQDLNFSEYVIETDISCLHLLKAGSFGADYPDRVNTFPWEALYNRAPWLIPWFGTWLAEKYEFVLIDSRTGVTDTSGICTMLLPEKLIIVFTPNLQSTGGAIEQLGRATNYRRRSDDLRPLMIYPLPSRIEIDLRSLQEHWRFDPECGYQPRFEREFKRIYGLEACDLSEYFNQTQVPQVREYAYGEEIAVLVERGAEAFSLTRAFTDFTARILSVAEPWELPVPEGDAEAVGDAVRRADAIIAQLTGDEKALAKKIRLSSTWCGWGETG